MRTAMTLIIALMITQPAALEAQNATVNWFTLNGGFGLTSVQSGRVLTMSAGQPVVAVSSGSNRIVESGFLAHPALRGMLVGVHEADNIPVTFSLEQNYPNPFNPSTTVSFGIPYSSFVTLRVYDLLGREVGSLVNEEKGPGTYSVMLDATALASGVYFYRLQTTGFVETKKLMVLR